MTFWVLCSTFIYKFLSFWTASSDESDNDSFKDIESDDEGDSESEKHDVSKPKKPTLNLQVALTCMIGLWMRHCVMNIYFKEVFQHICIVFYIHLAGKEKSDGCCSKGATLHFSRYI